MSIYDVFSGGNRPFDKEEWAAAKQAQRKEAYELIDNTCSEMMASGGSFRQYLDVQGSFDRYSVANAILVSAQMPEATQLKEYSKWKANRVYVNKDAQKIIILEPSKEYTREDGTKGISYNAKVVYDISETSAKDRQQEQEPKSMRELVSALIDASPVPCVPVGELELPAYSHLCKHIHLPVQSGSDRLLQQMNRHYTAQQYRELIDYAREKIPGVTFSSDIIVGFPGETEEDFQKTLELVEDVGYMQLFTFIYSKREGTPAAKMEDPITRAEKTERMDRLLRTQERVAFAAIAQLVGQTVRVLVEGSGRLEGTLNGRLDNNLVVEFAGSEDLIGQYAQVRLTGSRAALLLGERCEE